MLTRLLTLILLCTSLVVLFLFLEARYIHRSIFKTVPSEVLSETYRMHAHLYRGGRMSVGGFLVPVWEGSELVNLSLLPNEHLTRFSYPVHAEFHVFLLLRPELDPEAINTACLNQFVIVAGRAEIFSGVPAIGEISSIVAVNEGQFFDCFEPHNGSLR